MRRLFIIIALSFINFNGAFADEINVTPTIVNYYSIQEIGGDIFVLGDFGCGLVSRDSCATWKRIRPFKRGEIITLIQNQPNQIFAINSLGEISVSEDRGRTWSIYTDLKINCLAAVKNKNGYFVRTNNSLILLDDEFAEINEVPLITNTDFYYAGNFIKYNNSITVMDGKLIVESDTSRFIRFSANLSPIDTLDLRSMAVINDTSHYNCGYNISSDSVNMFFSVWLTAKKNGNYSSFIAVYKTKDFNNIELVREMPAYSLYSLRNGEINYINRLQNKLSDSAVLSGQAVGMSGQDIYKYNNSLLVAGKYGILKSIHLPDSVLSTYSDGSIVGSMEAPDLMEDGTLVFYSGIYNKYFLPVTLSKEPGDVLLPWTETKSLPIENKKGEYYLYLKHYDTTLKRLHYIGKSAYNTDALHLISDNYGKSFTTEKINGLQFSGNQQIPVQNASIRSNLHKLNDYFYAAIGQYGTDDYKNSILVFNKDFTLKKKITLANNIIDYVAPLDTNRFIIHCTSNSGTTNEIRYTEDGGKNWKKIKNYPSSYTEFYIKEFMLKNRKYLGIVNYDSKETLVIFDVLDCETQEITNIKSWSGELVLNIVRPSALLTYDNDFLYLAFLNTLYAIPDLFNPATWRVRTIPYNCLIYGDLKKFGNRFLTQYYDEFTPSTGFYYWLEPEIPLNANENYSVEIRRNYLFMFPPYPVPAKNEVRALIYWDTSLDIDKDDISVYNLFSKVAGREDVTIEKTMPYSGYLVWNCSRYEPGVYFIVINHGDATQMIKAIVE